jgi:aspartyl protease family protein
MLRLAPGQLSDVDRFDAWRLFGLLALVSSGAVFVTRRQLGQSVRHAAIWLAVVALLVLGYTFRDDLLNVGKRVRAELIPAYAVTSAPHILVVNASEDGNFYIMGAVNAVPVRFLIDTGASDVVLSKGDATRVGLAVDRLDYGHIYETANGAGRGASVTVDHLAIGPIGFSQVPVSVDQAPMDSSLLGMSFLRRLDAFTLRGHQLFLRWREPG